MDQPGDWVEASLELLRELFEGAKSGDSESPWIVEDGVDTGVFGVLLKLSAERASRVPATGSNTIAAHAEHLRYSFERANAWPMGLLPQGDYEEHWKIQTVDESAWRALLDDLQMQYERFLKNLATAPNPSQWTVTGYISHIGHVGYHLGAIRTLVGTQARE